MIGVTKSATFSSFREEERFFFFVTNYLCFAGVLRTYETVPKAKWHKAFPEKGGKSVQRPNLNLRKDLCLRILGDNFELNDDTLSD